MYIWNKFISVELLKNEILESLIESRKLNNIELQRFMKTEEDMDIKRWDLFISDVENWEMRLCIMKVKKFGKIIKLFKNEEIIQFYKWNWQWKVPQRFICLTKDIEW